MISPRRWLPLMCLALLATSACERPKSGAPTPTAAAMASAGTAAPAAPAELMLKGVETARLSPRERREWAAQVTELLAPCAEVPVSVAQCVTEDRPCKACLPAAQLLLRQVELGRPREEREGAFHARFDAGLLKTVVTNGSPEMGPSNAVVTIVEWGDFECHSCRAVYPDLEELVRRYPSQVRIVFKFYPFAVHPHGESTARAAVAAFRQGKFWPMHHLLFDNKDHLDQSDLERYAKQLNLDVARFRTDLGSKEVGEFIERDKKQADALGISRTPFILINGRPVNFRYVTGARDFDDWVKVEIELAGEASKGIEAAASAPRQL